MAVAPRAEIAYRRDIDGLRAVAVSFVILGHLGLRGVSGGFVGVDIFFVISGYLIVGRILTDLESGRFGLVAFYERRTRRIAPALAVMLAASGVVAYVAFFPPELVRYAWSLLATTYSASNFYFYASGTGYFAPEYGNVLLHTWSLGVEEQFYLFIPLALSLLTKRRVLLRPAIAVAACGSLVAACALTLSAPNLNFYMPYLRAWELFSGGLVACGMLPRLVSRAGREIVGASAFLWLAACATLYSATTPFPGITAVLPCAATVLLLLVGESGGAATTAFLAWRPFVGVGLISYSLYLWHWPIIVAVRLGVVPGVRDDTALGITFVVAASLATGWASWRFVEHPFRARDGRIDRRRLLGIVAVSAALFTTFAACLVSNGGFPGRFGPRALAVGAFADRPPSVRSGTCFIESDATPFDAAGCLRESADRPNILLFGDSHAAALWLGLRHALPHANIMQATLAACPPTVGAYERSNCSQLRELIYERFLPTHRVDAAILSQRWFGEADAIALIPAIARFRSYGIPVTVVGPVPEYTAPLPVLLALGIAHADSRLAERNRIDELAEVDRHLRDTLAAQSGVRYASIWDAICSPASCRTSVAGGIPMLSDSDHLTNAASIEIVGQLVATGQIRVSGGRIR